MSQTLVICVPTSTPMDRVVQLQEDAETELGVKVVVIAATSVTVVEDGGMVSVPDEVLISYPGPGLK